MISPRATQPSNVCFRSPRVGSDSQWQGSRSSRQGPFWTPRWWTLHQTQFLFPCEPQPRSPKLAAGSLVRRFMRAGVDWWAAISQFPASWESSSSQQPRRTCSGSRRKSRFDRLDFNSRELSSRASVTPRIPEKPWLEGNVGPQYTTARLREHDRSRLATDTRQREKNKRKPA